MKLQSTISSGKKRIPQTGILRRRASEAPLGATQKPQKVRLRSARTEWAAHWEYFPPQKGASAIEAPSFYTSAAPRLISEKSEIGPRRGLEKKAETRY